MPILTRYTELTWDSIFMLLLERREYTSMRVYVILPCRNKYEQWVTIALDKKDAERRFQKLNSKLLEAQKHKKGWTILYPDSMPLIRRCCSTKLDRKVSQLKKRKSRRSIIQQNKGMEDRCMGSDMYTEWVSFWWRGRVPRVYSSTNVHFTKAGTGVISSEWLNSIAEGWCWCRNMWNKRKSS